MPIVQAQYPASLPVPVLTRPVARLGFLMEDGGISTTEIPQFILYGAPTVDTSEDSGRAAMVAAQSAAVRSRIVADDASFALPLATGARPGDLIGQASAWLQANRQTVIWIGAGLFGIVLLKGMRR